MKRLSVMFYCVLNLYAASSQNVFQGQVKDRSNGLAVAFCAVGIKGSNLGCLSNEDGFFRLRFNPISDTLIFQVLGYKTQQIPGAEFLKNSVINLVPQASLLQEITVSGNDEFLYTVVENCRKKLMDFTNHQSRVYFVLETSISGKPVEMLECYYNGTFTNARVKDLLFKNGRVGVAPLDDRYFVTLDVSNVFTYLDLLNPHEKLPAIPFHFEKKKLKKHYRLNLLKMTDSSASMYLISFTPRRDSSMYFKGKVWIDKQTQSLLKIELSVNKTSHHPFIPAHQGIGEIQNASMNIVKSFSISGNNTYLSYMRFDYDLSYTHLHQTSFLNKNPDTTFHVKSEGLMYFYDHSRLFILPRFDYDKDLSDYRKILSLGYNERFWQDNSQLMYSKKMQKELQYFNMNGTLLNYRNAYNIRHEKTADIKGFAFEDGYVPWSAQKRIALKNNVITGDAVPIKKDTALSSSKSANIPALAYNLKAQIFLDINPSGDSLQHYSVTVLDVYETSYKLAKDEYTNCFLNIFFDLCEIERRKMEKELKGALEITAIDKIYEETKRRMGSRCSDYMKEVDRGKNKKQLEKWNELVKTELGIDNLELYGLKGL